MPHIHEDIDFTVDVYVVYKNKVLLRMHEKYNMWLAVGGHVELTEDVNEAAIREVKEEVGLDVVLDNHLQTFHLDNKNFKELIPPYHFNIHTINERHRHSSLVYFARSNSDFIIQPEGEEKSSACVWFTKEEIEKHPDLNPEIRYYALHALTVLGE